MSTLKSFYTGKSVFITGGSSGIGAATAVVMAGLGAQVVVTARRADMLASVVDKIKLEGGQALAIACDVTSRADLDQAFELARQTFGKIDIVVANAGMGVEGPADRLTTADYRRQFEVNVFGVLDTIYAGLDEIKRNHGAVVLVGSVMGYAVVPAMSPYTMSKFAITALAETLHQDLRPLGVSVTLISPGLIDTEIRRVGNDGVLKSQSKDPAPKWLMMSAEKAARLIARAVARGRREKILTLHAAVLIWVARHFPGILRILGGRLRPRGRVRDHRRLN